MKSVRLPRRTVLRGAGLGALGIALPTLDAMVNGQGAWYGRAEAQPVKPPVRLLLYMFPDGIPRLETWRPAVEGKDYQLTPCLEPFASIKNELSVLSGIRHTAYAMKTVPDDHNIGNASLFVGQPVPAGGSGGTSLDQVVASARPSGTRYSSLQITASTRGSNGSIQQRCLSWQSSNSPLQPIGNPVTLFSMLFGAAPGGAPVSKVEADKAAAAAALVAARRRSVLDFVRTQAQDLRKTLGTSDRGRLDAHLTSIREIEQQLQLRTDGAAPVSTVRCDSPPTPAASTIEDDAHIVLMHRLAALAFKCDLTRVMILQQGYTVCGLKYEWLPTSVGPKLSSNHDLSHSSSDRYVPVTQYKMRKLAEFLSLLKQSPEAGGSVLDNAFVCCTSEMGHGHKGDTNPVLIAGRAGGRVRVGEHIVYPAGTPLNRLWLTALKVMDVAGRNSFGMDGKEPLAGFTV